MRIKEKSGQETSSKCAKMTDEKIMNGDKTSSNRQNQQPQQSQSLRQVASPLDNSGAKLKSSKVNSGVKEEGKDDVLNPESPNICSEEYNSGCGGGGAGGGRLKFFKDGKFILELSHRKEGEKTCWIPVPKKTYWPVIGTPRQESSTSLSVSDDNSSIQSSPWQRDHCWKQTTPRPNLSRELEFQLIRPKRFMKFLYTSQALRSKRRRPFDTSTVDETLLERVSYKPRKRSPLRNIVQSLWERVVTMCKPEPGIVSPRKRILRELERVTLEEATKRQRARAPTRNISSHSISSILAKEDESVLRTLLRSPSPDASSVRSRVPPSPYIPPPSHLVHAPLYPATSNAYYPSVTNQYRGTHVWPVHYPVSSPPLHLPIYPVPPYSSSWPHLHRPMPQETSPDMPLNLSKNAG